MVGAEKNTPSSDVHSKLAYNAIISVPYLLRTKKWRAFGGGAEGKKSFFVRPPPPPRRAPRGRMTRPWALVPKALMANRKNAIKLWDRQYVYLHNHSNANGLVIRPHCWEVGGKPPCVSAVPAMPSSGARSPSPQPRHRARPACSG